MKQSLSESLWHLSTNLWRYDRGLREEKIFPIKVMLFHCVMQRMWRQTRLPLSCLRISGYCDTDWNLVTNLRPSLEISVTNNTDSLNMTAFHKLFTHIKIWANPIQFCRVWVTLCVCVHVEVCVCTSLGKQRPGNSCPVTHLQHLSDAKCISGWPRRCPPSAK